MSEGQSIDRTLHIEFFKMRGVDHVFLFLSSLCLGYLVLLAREADVVYVFK